MIRQLRFLCVVPLIVIIGHVSVNGQSARHSRQIVIPVNLNSEKELQLEVDKGHQPWRLEPTDVAQAELITDLDKNIKYDDCHLQSESDFEAIVVCKDSKIYSVYLKRLIRKKGIWTVTEIQIAD